NAIRHRDGPCFGGHCEKLVAGDRDAKRPETVAVERCAAGPAVRETERGRPVPRLAQHRTVTVEVTDLVVEPGIVLPGRRYEHGKSLRDLGAVLANEQF